MADDKRPEWVDRQALSELCGFRDAICDRESQVRPSSPTRSAYERGYWLGRLAMRRLEQRIERRFLHDPRVTVKLRDTSAFPFDPDKISGLPNP